MPRLVTRQKRRTIGHLKLDPDEEREIRAAAQRAGKPVMAWVRSALLEYCKIDAALEVRRG